MFELSPDTIKQHNSELEELVRLKDQKIQEMQERIDSMEQQIVQISNNADIGYQTYQMDYLLMAQQQNRTYFSEKAQLELKFLQLRCKFREQALTIKTLQDQLAPSPPKSNSNADPKKLEHENQKLMSLISLHKNNEEDFKTQLEEANEMIKKEKEKVIKLQQEGKSAFNELCEKLKIERTQKESQSQNDVSEAMIQQLNKTIQEKESQLQNDEKKIQEKDFLINQLMSEKDSLSSLLTSTTAACENFKANQNKLYEDLSKILNTEPNIQNIVGSIQHLITLPNQIEVLKQKLEHSNQVQQNDPILTVIIDSLKEVISNLSPDELSLQPQSELKQLFAAIVNMLNAAISPNPTNAMLVPHIKAVVYQARYFVGKVSGNPLPDMKDKRSSPSTVSEYIPLV